MATRSLVRYAGLAAGLAICAVRGASAQAAIHVGATVTAPAGMITIHGDSAAASAPMPGSDVQRVRVAGIGGIDVQAGVGAAVRVAPGVLTTDSSPGGDNPVAAGPPRPRVVRISIDFVGS